ncbi:LysM peptidoglycan-binding domain-containing protein [Ilumatobacter sp.]|uniref:LysM peptidoglycan-binding domain-containing protein n=1 Tax=Ilumatobacter sp. TaxID=1967498 RepID=UPI003AF73317
MINIDTEFRLDQPRPNDLVGSPLLVAGMGGGTESTIGIRVLDANGRVIENTFTNSAWMARPWQKSVDLTNVSTTRGLVMVGPDSGENDPPWVSVPVFFGTAIVPTFRSYFSYVVQQGDTLSSIAADAEASQLYEGSGWQPIFRANEHIIADPDLIHPGMVLRIPAGF